MIDGFSANVIGTVGSALIVFAFAYNVCAGTVSSFVYNRANLLGALLLTLSLMVHFNLASLLLEIAWIIIAVGGLAKVYRDQARLLP
ncbi:hypothetical protein [Parasphingorhabdus sp.]|jgi:hypothetical protein|uniref:CBU_0592 family membrane protein n=1 Tax=Parasphingorhabdus sp. TaxID=2709688 RepID=UPI0030AD186C|nr:hypothetical protein [Sphingomonadales bacterium]